MARTAIKGTNLLISIGVPAAATPVAVYAAAPAVQGLPIISSITNEPTTLLYVPTSKNSTIYKTKTSERHKFNGGTEVGDTFEQDEAIMGSIEAMLVRSVTDDSLYDPAIDMLINAATTSNLTLYVKMEIWLGLATPATLGHSYYTRAGIVKVKSDNAAHQSDSKAIMRTFQLEGSGNFIEGYLRKL